MNDVTQRSNLQHKLKEYIKGTWSLFSEGIQIINILHEKGPFKINKYLLIIDWVYKSTSK